MRNVRSDFKYDRTKQIYEEYVKSKTSYNQLAKKYGVSPQRISYLISDYRKKDLHKGLSITAPKEDREARKNIAVELREKGKPSIAVEIFEEVISWDEANNNPRGKMDVLGHKKIALVLQADKAPDDKRKRELLSEAVACIEESLAIGESLEVPGGAKAIQQVHLASMIFNQSQYLSQVQAGTELRKAVEILTKAIEVLPGSEAHKAWAFGIKAKLLHRLGQDDKALQTLFEAQAKLYEGYDAEIKGADQADIKLRVWSSGIQLGFAQIYFDQKRLLLAEIHASAVVNTPDPQGVLKARKKEAKDILNRL